MSEEDGRVDVEVEHPHVHHNHHVGRGWLGLALPLAALFVSFVSIGIAWKHGKVMQDLVHQNERLVQANSLPHLSLALTESVGAPGQQNIRFTASNGGIGPAEIRTVELLYDGKPVRSSRELLKLCCGLDTGEYYWAPMRNRMLRPGESVHFFDIRTRSETVSGMPRLTAAKNSGRILARVCYCSVFSECWVRTSQQEQRPSSVGRQCTAPPIPYTH